MSRRATGPKPEAFVELDRVSFGYDTTARVLSDLSLRFPRGQVTTILGGSGCGKTTLMRLVGGLQAADAGRVLIDGEVLDPRHRRRLYALRRRMGMLFQFGALFTDLTVYENVAFPLREHTSLPEAAVRDLVLMKLQAVGLRGAVGLRIGQLSGGMARRVALARAIALDPELILYDEPFAGLDPISIGVTAQLIRRLNDATGATSLVVSHDVAQCMAISDRVVLLARQGRIVAQGTPAQLMAGTDPETRQFLRGEPDGPLRFHHPAPGLAADFGLTA
ncbi:ABC transporter ATP-binding protein [Aquincola sp. J276]|uniref:ABC transporter ATP-binding protein n=1 Tax=Aquincola sp. J276 TaxID=2898432 RepID=UPI002150B0FF|nr:ATP-binding cassette domain-containing protein [Aquincola sp. J276]MCR5868666.1 ATP-binding cassette domain-containing protein [Aquincola sp. J276]